MSPRDDLESARGLRDRAHSHMLTRIHILLGKQVASCPRSTDAASSPSEPPSASGELAELLARHAHFDADLSVIDEVVVFASYLSRSGPTHEALGRAELGT